MYQLVTEGDQPHRSRLVDAVCIPDEGPMSKGTYYVSILEAKGVRRMQYGPNHAREGRGRIPKLETSALGVLVELDLSHEALCICRACLLAEINWSNIP